jgi:hypothetical protein
MILKGFGCSFIFGTDLTDLVSGFDPNGSKFTWPALLAQHKSLDYKCYAVPGSGNLQILEKILNQISMSDPMMFVISWSYSDRFDYYPSYSDKNPLGKWKTIMPNDISDVAKVYYRDLQSEYRDKFSNLSYIKIAVDTLNQKQIPFVMTYMDESLFDRKFNTAAMAYLQDYVQPHMTTFDGLTFLNWSRKHGHPISQTSHPLESAHAAAAKLIESYNLV